MKHLSRRSILAGLGASAALLPFIPKLEQEAHAAEPPKRLLIFFTSNGVVPEYFFPSGSENNWQLTPILEPLAAFKQDLIVTQGINMSVVQDGPIGGHTGGIAAVLTGREIMDGSFTVSNKPGVYFGWGGGISIDQHVANTIGNETLYRSLELGIKSDKTFNPPEARMIYTGPEEPVYPEQDPGAAWDRIFGDLDLDDSELIRLQVERRSILDHVIEDVKRLQPRLSTSDRLRVDRHLDSLRTLEARIFATVPASCTPPTRAGFGNPTANANIPAVGKAQMDLIANAFECDLTRVASIQWGAEAWSARYDWLGISDGHHTLSHYKNDPEPLKSQKIEKLKQICIWNAEQLAYMLGELQSRTDPGGTPLLDNTLVLWCSGIAKGDHKTVNMPFVLAGGAGGWQTGRYLQYSNQPHNDLLVSIANAMGVPTSTFGNPNHCNGPLVL